MARSYGTVSAERKLTMSGLEFVQGLASGALPLNTIARTLGYDVTEAERGRVVVTLLPTDAHLNPAGTVHGGLTATLLDTRRSSRLSRGRNNRRWGQSVTGW